MLSGSSALSSTTTPKAMVVTKSRLVNSSDRIHCNMAVRYPGSFDKSATCMNKPCIRFSSASRLAGGAGRGDHRGQLVGAGVVRLGPGPVGGQSGSRHGQGLRVPVDAEDPEILAGIEQGHRVAGAAEGGVDHGAGGHGVEELEHPVQQDRVVDEGTGVGHQGGHAGSVERPGCESSRRSKASRRSWMGPNVSAG